MFPHHKIDWHLSRLEGRLDQAPDDAATRLDYAEHCLSKAMFHDGGEPWLNRALTQARRVLGTDPTNTGSLVIAGVALVGLERLEPASRYLDQALKEDHRRADVHFGLGLMNALEGDRHQALREFEIACRLAPESFEAHHKLALVLWARARELGTPKRLLERSQFHTTRALSLDPTPAIQLQLQFHLAMTALHTKRWADAHKLLYPLLESERLADRARYSLGVASYHLGKHKNAILYLRQHLQNHPEDPRVHARIGMSFLQLGEFSKARTACNRALAVDPTNTEARWTLGCALIEEGQRDDAIQVFKDLLADQPEHIPAFTELVRLRVEAGDLRWLERALRTEVSGFDRLPVKAVMEGPHGEERPVTPRAATRNRVAILLKALGDARRPGHDAVSTALSCIALTTDEGMRHLLWEAALRFTSEHAAARVVKHLDQPGVQFDPAVARELLALTDLVPEDLITRGLNVTEEDLNRAAVDRHGPARDLTVHRKRIESEREVARAWQAQLLLALGSRGGANARNLLVRWEAEADRDLRIAAQTALALRGEPEDTLRNEARRFRAEGALDALNAGLAPVSVHNRPTPLPDGSPTPCSTCGRRVSEVGHILRGADAAVCDRCMGEIAGRRREIATDDPARECALCHKTNTQTRGVFVYQGVAICSDCLDQSLGLVEREAVDRYFLDLAAR